MKVKKAFITGISGMVGSHLAEYLVKNTNWNIDGMIRWRSSLQNLNNIVPLANDRNRVNFIYADLKDSYSIDEAIKKSKPDYIFHLAAQSFPQASFNSPLDTFDTNIHGTERILSAIKKFSPNSIIHICSSSEVFGKVPKNKIPIDENCTFHPASPYAISKVGTDLLSKFYFEAYGLKTLTTRMFTHTGPRRGDMFAESTFAKQIAMIEKDIIKPIIKVGNLESLRTIADVRDAVKAYYLLVTKNPIPGEIYNIGGEYSCKIKDILDFLIGISTKKNIRYEIDSGRLRPIDADLQIPNTKKFQSHTGWKPEYKFEETMTDLLNYWRQQIDINPHLFLTR